MASPEPKQNDSNGAFSDADDLLWEAQHGRLHTLGPINVRRSGRLGPLIELLMARHENPTQFVQVAFTAPFASVIDRAIADGVITGSGLGAKRGVFPLVRLSAMTDQTDAWTLWRLRAEQAAIAAGFGKLFAASIIGALGELQDNVMRHSGRPDTGLVAFAATASAFEVVVSDAGVGVLT